MIKMLNKLGIEETYFNVTKANNNKPTVIIILNGARLKDFPLIRNKMRVLTLTIPLHQSTGILAREIRQGKEINCIQIGKEQAKLSLFVDDMILHTENPRDSTQTLLKLINKFSKVVGRKINTQLHFYTLEIQSLKKKY